MRVKSNNYIFNSINTTIVVEELKISKHTWNYGTKPNISSKSSSPKKIRKPRNRINYKRQTIRSYKGYMVSNLWVERKNRYWKEHGRKCKACGGFSHVTLHHMYYSGVYGQEPDTDVIALCGGCHYKFHQNNKLRKDMRKATYRFIDEVHKNKQLFLDSEELDNQFVIHSY